MHAVDRHEKSERQASEPEKEILKKLARLQLGELTESRKNTNPGD